MPRLTREQRLVDDLIIATRRDKITWREGAAFDLWTTDYKGRHLVMWWYQDEGPYLTIHTKGAASDIETARICGLGLRTLIEIVREKLHPITPQMQRDARKTAADAQREAQRRKQHADAEIDRMLAEE